MGGNDPLVEAVEAAGVRTWTPDDMAAALLETCETCGPGRCAGRAADGRPDRWPRRRPARHEGARRGHRASGRRRRATRPATIAALAAVAGPARPRRARSSGHRSTPVPRTSWSSSAPASSARTARPAPASRWRCPTSCRPPASSSWRGSTGLVSWDAAGGGWFDTATQEKVDEAELAERYEEAVRERCGIRRYVDEGAMVDNSAPLLTSVFLDKDLTFTVGNEAEARALRDADPERTVIAATADGDWTVTRKAGTEIRVPRRMKLTRTVGGQIPTGFDPTVWGVPAEMVESIDRVGAVEPDLHGRRVPLQRLHAVRADALGPPGAGRQHAGHRHGRHAVDAVAVHRHAAGREQGQRHPAGGAAERHRGARRAVVRRLATARWCTRSRPAPRRRSRSRRASTRSSSARRSSSSPAASTT